MNRMLPDRYAAWIIVCIIGSLAGCRGAMEVPRGWTPLPADQPTLSAERDEQPRLQVFIHYNDSRSTHAALRVTSPHGPAVMWDPGGGYQLDDTSYGRRNDVVVDRPPALETWWVYRVESMNEPVALVFEWDITPHHAARMQQALLRGAEGSGGRLNTRRRPGFCGFAVSDFLRHFGPPRIDINWSYFWPDSLAKRLWTQHPDRVLRYSGLADAPPAIYVPPEGES